MRRIIKVTSETGIPADAVIVDKTTGLKAEGLLIRSLQFSAEGGTADLWLDLGDSTPRRIPVNLISIVCEFEIDIPDVNAKAA